MSKFLFALAALAAAASAPAAARTDAPATRIVRYADLDLSAAAGRNTLEQRIGAAVRAVCGSTAPDDFRGDRAVRACRSEALARVVRPAPARAALGATQ
jgi:UrcA family protein